MLLVHRSATLLLTAPLLVSGCPSADDDAAADTEANATVATAADDAGTVSSPDDGGDAPEPTDAGPDDDGPDDGIDDDDGTDESGDTGPQIPDGVPMFVATGHAGRTTISCDDGQTWVADTSNDDTLRCFDPFDCDHDTGSAHGVVYGDGWFVASFGWGTPGSVVRSRDGVQWEPVTQRTRFGDMAFHDGVFLAGARDAQLSVDSGASWAASGDTMMSVYNVRRVGSADVDGGRFIMVASDETTEVVLSSDGGASWWHPETLPTGCGQGVQTQGGIIEGDGTILIVGGDGMACTSVDGGTTWTASNVGGQVGSHVIWDGEAFMVWGAGNRFRSTDGVTWTSATVSPAGIDIGVVARNPATGTIAAVRGGWQVWYEDQAFYRSADGLTFEVLAPSSFTGGHPIRSMTFGYGEPSPDCSR